MTPAGRALNRHSRGTQALMGVLPPMGRTGNPNFDRPARSIELPTSTKNPPSLRLEPLCERPQGAVALSNPRHRGH